MKRFLKSGLFAGIFGVFVLVVTGLNVYARLNPADLTDHVRSTALITSETGHGTGVFLTPNHVLTAAHVVRDRASFSISTADGRASTAEVLWLAKDVDLALVYVHNRVGAGLVHLSCANPTMGEEVQTVGNPHDFRFSVQRGHIARAKPGPGGNSEDIPADAHQQWAIALMGVPGNSGGGVFDGSGRLVGILSRMALVPLGPFGYGIHSGYSLMVPSSKVCELLRKYETRVLTGGLN